MGYVSLRTSFCGVPGSDEAEAVVPSEQDNESTGFPTPQHRICGSTITHLDKVDRDTVSVALELSEPGGFTKEELAKIVATIRRLRRLKDVILLMDADRQPESVDALNAIVSSLRCRRRLQSLALHFPYDFDNNGVQIYSATYCR